MGLRGDWGRRLGGEDPLHPIRLSLMTDDGLQTAVVRKKQLDHQAARARSSAGPQTSARGPQSADGPQDVHMFSRLANGSQRSDVHGMGCAARQSAGSNDHQRSPTKLEVALLSGCGRFESCRGHQPKTAGQCPSWLPSSRGTASPRPGAATCTTPPGTDRNVALIPASMHSW
jgi:hypothetical protein